MILEVMRAIVQAVEEGRRGVVATVLTHKGSSPGKQDHKMLVLDDGTTVGSVGGGQLEAMVLAEVPGVLESGRGKALSILAADVGEDAIGMVCGGRAEVAMEVLPSVPRLLVCGAGHCSREVARLAAQLRYPVEVHDDRPELLEHEVFEAAAARHHGEPAEVVEDLGGLARFSHLVLMSRGHAVDRAYARAVLGAGFQGWVGMLGSRRKARIVRGLLTDEDGMPEDLVERMESPVGIPIGATSPGEIAVSIMARIIAHARGG